MPDLPVITPTQRRLQRLARERLAFLEPFRTAAGVALPFTAPQMQARQQVVGGAATQVARTLIGGEPIPFAAPPLAQRIPAVRRFEERTRVPSTRLEAAGRAAAGFLGAGEPMSLQEMAQSPFGALAAVPPSAFAAPTAAMGTRQAVQALRQVPSEVERAVGRPILPATRRAVARRPAGGMIEGEAAADIRAADQEIAKLANAIKVASKAGAPTREIEETLAMMRQTRRSLLESSLSLEDLARFQELEPQIEEARALLQGVKEIAGPKAPFFGSSERAEYDNLRRLASEAGKPLRNKKQLVQAATAKLRALEDEYNEIAALAPERKPVVMEARTAVQPGLGIGEKAPQTEMFPELQGRAEAVGMPTAEELLARERAKPLPGQAALPEATPPPAAITEPMFIVDPEGAIAHVLDWSAEGKPIVVYPGKTGGLYPSTAPVGQANMPRRYTLTSAWREVTADDWSKAIRPSKSEKMLDLRTWRGVFTSSIRQAAAPAMRQRQLAEAQAARRAILESRIRRGEPVEDSLLEEFPDLKVKPSVTLPAAITPSVPSSAAPARATLPEVPVAFARQTAAPATTTPSPGTAMFKPLSYGAGGTANLMQSPTGELVERIATGTKKGWWKVTSGTTEYMGKTPESAVALAHRRAGVESITVRPIGQPTPPATSARVLPHVTEPSKVSALKPAAVAQEVSVQPPGAAGVPPSEAAGAVQPPSAPAAALPPVAPPPTVPPVGTGALPPEGGDPLEKLTGLLRAAKPVRRETEALKHEARQRQAAMLARMQEAAQGEQEFQRAKGLLKGELPQAVFTPPAGTMTQPERDALFRQLAASQLRPFEKVAAGDALEGVIQGRLPTLGQIELLERVFGPEFSKALLTNQPWTTKLADAIEEALSLPKSLAFGFDLSFTLRQGGYFAVGENKAWREAFAAQLKALRSKELVEAMERQREAHRFYEMALDAGLDLTRVSEKTAFQIRREEQFIGSRYLRKFPVLGKAVELSERAYGAGANEMRWGVFRRWAEAAEATGTPLTAAQAKAVAKLINAATGRGSLFGLERSQEMSRLLRVAFTSARFATSRFETIPRVIHAAAITPQLRVRLLSGLVKWMGSRVALLTLLDASGLAKVELDPRSSDWGKITIAGKIRYDPWSGFQQAVRFLAQEVSGQRKPLLGKGVTRPGRGNILFQFGRSKLAPWPGGIVTAAVGKDFTGQRITLRRRVLEATVEPFLNVGLQDFWQASQEMGIWPGAALATPVLFGAGAQFFDPQESAVARRGAGAGQGARSLGDLRKLYRKPTPQTGPGAGAGRSIEDLRKLYRKPVPAGAR